MYLEQFHCTPFSSETPFGERVWTVSTTSWRLGCFLEAKLLVQKYLVDPSRGKRGNAGTARQPGRCRRRTWRLRIWQTWPRQRWPPTPPRRGGTGASYGGAYRVTYKTPATHVFFGSFIGVTLYRIFGAWNTTELYMGVSKNSGTPKWMVKIVENPMKMYDLRGKPTSFRKHPYKTSVTLFTL